MPKRPVRPWQLSTIWILHLHAFILNVASKD